MISKRLLSLSKYIDKNDCVADVGCDHGLLSIYLYENKLCKYIIASDVNKNALQNAIDNIKIRNLEIETIVSDGIDSLPLDKLNTLIISGMGTSTILHILKDNNKLINVSKIILQSNNEYEKLREEMNNRGYYLDKENIVYDNKKYYTTMKFIKSSKKNSEEEIEFGLLDNLNKEYYQFLIDKYSDIAKKIPSLKDKELLLNKIKKLKNYL